MGRGSDNMKERPPDTKLAKSCCFGCLTFNLVLGTPAIIYLFNFWHWEQIGIWWTMILAIITAEISVPLAVIIRVLH
jgi:hypothetical protein